MPRDIQHHTNNCHDLLYGDFASTFLWLTGLRWIDPGDLSPQQNENLKTDPQMRGNNDYFKAMTDGISCVLLFQIDFDIEVILTQKLAANSQIPKYSFITLKKTPIRNAWCLPIYHISEVRALRSEKFASTASETPLCHHFLYIMKK